MVHANFLCSGLGLEPHARRLASMYAGFGDLDGALSVLRALPDSGAPVWNVVLKTHVDSGLFETGLAVFCGMGRSGVRPDHYTFPLVNRAVASLHGRLGLGEAVHCLCLKMGLGVDLYVCNTMLEVYLGYGRLSAARLLFDEMPIRDVVSWTSMISGYVRSEKICDSFRLFQEMQMAGFRPNSVTLQVFLRVCTTQEHLALVKQLHGFAIKGGFGNSVSTRNSILTAFSKIGHLEEAEMVFQAGDNRDVVSWNIMISGYSLVSDVSRVMECFNKMRVGLIPSHETFTSVISTCTKSRDILLGQMMHSHVVKSAQTDAVLQACLLDFYAKCGELESAVRLFEERGKSITLCSTMISGFVQSGFFDEAIDLFRQMQIAGFELGPDILGSILLACANLGSPRMGKGVHGYLLRNWWVGAGARISLETSLLSMYARCGNVLLAERCFSLMIAKDVVAWSSIIECYAIHGIGLEALRLFYQMQEERVIPNSVTFLSVLSACSHCGLVTEGCKVFDAMTRNFGIKPELNHYTCMVDLLGRVGMLEEALQVIHNMDVEPDGRIWGALLSSCRTYCKTNLGMYAAQRLFDLEHDNAGYHVVLCNIHASVERWGEAENMRKAFMGGNDFRKGPGWSCIEERGLCQKFVAGHISHPREGEIHEALVCLTRHIEGNGILRDRLLGSCQA